MEDHILHGIYHIRFMINSFVIFGLKVEVLMDAKQYFVKNYLQQNHQA